MKKQKVFGLGLLLAGIGLMMNFSIGADSTVLGQSAELWKVFGLVIACPALLACVYAMLSMKEE